MGALGRRRFLTSGAKPQQRNLEIAPALGCISRAPRTASERGSAATPMLLEASAAVVALLLLVVCSVLAMDIDIAAMRHAYRQQGQRP